MFRFARSAQKNELALKHAAEDRAFVLGAITSCVAFLESLVNEIFMLASEPIASSYGKLPAQKVMLDLWEDVASKLPILAKYDLVLALNGCPPIDHGKMAYQDASSLVQLRNAVVHYRVGIRQHPDPEPISIEKRLAGKFPSSPYYPSLTGPFFPHKCLSAGCAAWAARSACSFADEFHQKLGISGTYALHDVPKLLDRP